MENIKSGTYILNDNTQKHRAYKIIVYDKCDDRGEKYTKIFFKSGSTNHGYHGKHIGSIYDDYHLIIGISKYI